MTRKTNGTALAVGAVLFAALSVAMIGLFVTGKVSGIDQIGFTLAAAMRAEGWTAFFRVLTYLGSAVVLAPVGVVLITLLYAKRLRAEAVTLLLTLGGGEVLNELLKAVFARPRPTDFHLIQLPDSFSFPSGHAMIAPAFYCMLAYLASRWLEGRAWASWIQPAAFAVALLLGVSRVYLGVHFLSDVLTGWCLAFCGYFLVRCGYARHQEKQTSTVTPIVPSS